MSHMLYQNGEPAALVEVRASFEVTDGYVRPAGRPHTFAGRAAQRSRIRERILASGRTSLDGLRETKRILKARIKERTR